MVLHGPTITILEFWCRAQLRPVQFLQPRSERQVIRVCHNRIATLRVGKPQGAAAARNDHETGNDWDPNVWKAGSLWLLSICGSSILILVPSLSWPFVLKFKSILVLLHADMFDILLVVLHLGGSTSLCFYIHRSWIPQCFDKVQVPKDWCWRRQSASGEVAAAKEVPHHDQLESHLFSPLSNTLIRRRNPILKQGSKCFQWVFHTSIRGKRLENTSLGLNKLEITAASQQNMKIKQPMHRWIEQKSGQPKQRETPAYIPTKKDGVTKSWMLQSHQSADSEIWRS